MNITTSVDTGNIHLQVVSEKRVKYKNRPVLSKQIQLILQYEETILLLIYMNAASFFINKKTLFNSIYNYNINKYLMAAKIV